MLAKSVIFFLTAAMHGVRAEDRLQQRSAGAQPDPAWRLVSQGGAGGEQEELPEESPAHGGAGGGAEGETPITWTESGKCRTTKQIFFSSSCFSYRKNLE